jgi:hypothetical protein
MTWLFKILWRLCDLFEKEPDHVSERWLIDHVYESGKYRDR